MRDITRPNTTVLTTTALGKITAALEGFVSRSVTLVMCASELPCWRNAPSFTMPFAQMRVTGLDTCKKETGHSQSYSSNN